MAWWLGRVDRNPNMDRHGEMSGGMGVQRISHFVDSAFFFVALQLAGSLGVKKIWF